MIETDQILLADLVALKAKGTVLSNSQERELNRLIHQYPESKPIIDALFEKETILTPFDIRNISLEDEMNIFKLKNDNRKIKTLTKLNRWRSIAAVITAFLLISGLGVWYSINTKPNYIVEDTVYGQKNDILPGIQYAELYVDAGHAIELDGSPTQNLGDGLEMSNDFLIYKNSEKAGADNRKHLLSVPKRSTYKLVLSDGTKVWINPDSRLEYLESFSKNERRVKLKGEAFFDVAKDATRPFIVETDGMDIQAVGTAFNVKSYHDKPVVQLTEGKIKVRGKGKEVEINAGNQVLLADAGLNTTPLEHNEEATSWKDGFFYFNNKEISEIMEELSRWYGVEPIYRCNVNNKRYLGGIDKNSTLAQVCSVLSDLTDYSFKIEQEKLIIDKK